MGILRVKKNVKKGGTERGGGAEEEEEQKAIMVTFINEASGNCSS